MGKVTYLIARIAPIIIMGQTLFFKFSGAPESVYIFSEVGMEPWGRWMVGILELISILLLLLPRTAWMGGLLAAVLMFGAVGMHLTILGIEVQDDKGLLFIYALIVLPYQRLN